MDERIELDLYVTTQCEWNTLTELTLGLFVYEKPVVTSHGAIGLYEFKKNYIGPSKNPK